MLFFKRSWTSLADVLIRNQNPHSSASNQLSASLSLPFLSPVPADAVFLLIHLKFILCICSSSHPKKRKPEKNYNKYDNRKPNTTASMLLLLRSDIFCQPWKPVYQLWGNLSQLQFNNQLLFFCKCLFSSLNFHFWSSFIVIFMSWTGFILLSSINLCVSVRCWRQSRKSDSCADIN